MGQSEEGHAGGRDYHQGGDFIVWILIFRLAFQVHSDALKHPDMKTILHSKQDWDLVIASPLFNEVGVMLGNVARYLLASEISRISHEVW